MQTFATYGGARRGTPVMSSLRVDEQPIRVRSNIERADAMLCFDDSLLDQNFLRTADEKTIVVVNSAKPAEAFADLGNHRIVPIDGRKIARNNDMGKVINTTLLGAFVAMLKQPGIEAMVDVIEQNAPAKKQQNVSACCEAYELLQNDAGGK